MATIYYTVQKGDSLWSIAKNHPHINNSSKWPLIAIKNNIKPPYVINPGDNLDLDIDTSVTPQNAEPSRATNVFVGAVASDDPIPKEVMAGWDFTRANTESYKYVWYYWNSDNRKFSTTGSISIDKDLPAEDFRQVTYSIPSGAIRVAFMVLPISTKTTVNNVETSAWTAEWSTLVDYNTRASTIPQGDTPEVKMLTENDASNDILSASISGIDPKAGDLTRVEFQIIKDDQYIFNSQALYSSISSTGYASITYKVSSGHTYRVKARYWSHSSAGAWSSLSSEVTASPATPLSFTKYRAGYGPNWSITNPDIIVELAWEAVYNAESYTVQYAKSTESTTSSNVKTKDIKPDSPGEKPPANCTLDKNDLNPGFIYWFRVRANNSGGESKWSSTVSVAVGTKPSPPTTWSSKGNMSIDSSDTVILYWVHNSADNSEMSRATLWMEAEYYNGTETIKLNAKTASIVNNRDGTISWSTDRINGAVLKISDSVCSCELSGEVLRSHFKISNGYDFKVYWKVRTAGAALLSEGQLTFSEYSEPPREISAYLKPSLSVYLQQYDNGKWNDVTTITHLPFRIGVSTAPNSQKPLSYHIEIVSTDSYETIDNVGNVKKVNSGDSVFVRDVDITSLSYLEVSADEITLENNQNYKIRAKVSLNSGLTATNTSIDFNVAWEDYEYNPSAEVSIDYNTVSAYIHPYCKTLITDDQGRQTGSLVDGIKLSVYRRDFDGKFTEIASGIDNLINTWVVDPHPALDYARYRIIAKSEVTGKVNYHDISAYPVNEKSVIIQWAEAWTDFNITDDGPTEEKPWTGSMLKLPYNIDISNSYSPDKTTVQYAGREHPVVYYGTQVGETQTWNLDIVKSDKKTLYAIRRLSVWMGDVYVREPSGSGYWATINVSFSQKHTELTIPVTINVTRVEGGM